MPDSPNMPVAWSDGHFDWGYIKAVHRRHGSGRRLTRFPHYRLHEYLTGFRWTHSTLNILDYVDYSKTGALAMLQDELGWRDYGGKHHESIYTRWYQGVYLPRKFGFDKRRCHLSSRVCSGELTRDPALKELDAPTYDPALQEQDCEYVAKKLGLSQQRFDAIMSAAPRRFVDYPSYARFVSGPWYRRFARGYSLLRSGVLRRGRT